MNIKRIIKEAMGDGDTHDSMVIYYDDVDLWQPQDSYNQFLFFGGVSELPKSNTTKIVLVSNKTNDTIPLDGSMVKISKGKDGKEDRLRVIITNQNRAQVEPIIPREYSFDTISKDRRKWSKNSGDRWVWVVMDQMDKSIESVFKGKDLGVGHSWGKNLDCVDDDGLIGVLNFEIADGSSMWSIVNFFNTNPAVRGILINEYELWLEKNRKPITFNIDEFVEYIWLERESLFNPKTDIFKSLAKVNHITWGVYGVSNEEAASKHLKSVFKEGDYLVSDGGKPGCRGDASSGIDILVTQLKSGKKIGYQAKPLDSWSETTKGGRIIKSSELKKYDPKKVGWYIFGPNKSNHGDNVKGEFLIYKNNGERPRDSTTMSFKGKPFGKK